MCSPGLRRGNDEEGAGGGATILSHNRGMVVPSAVLAAAGALIGPAHLFLGQDVPPSPRLVFLEKLPEFSLTPEAVVSEVVDPGFAWNEMVVSWNVEATQGAALTIEARGLYPDRETKWYTIARWSLDGAGPRASVEGQKDEDGDVLTDTLRLSRPGARIQLRITALKQEEGQDPRWKLLALSFANHPARPDTLAPHRAAWGKTIAVPQRSQMSYPGGNVLCSPTAVSMVLSHWAKVLGRPDLDKDVPEVQEGVYDPVYGGTGNWPFNTAYAGSHPGLVAYVSRLDGVADLERWIEAGVPVVTSVSYSFLKGQERTRNDGHLVVLVGFTSTGDPVCNDPGRSKDVRQTYRRADFEKAWNHSGRTVYLIHPERQP
jgi:hypothetical protein